MIGKINHLLRTFLCLLYKKSFDPYAVAKDKHDLKTFVYDYVKEITFTRDLMSKRQRIKKRSAQLMKHGVKRFTN